MMSDLYLGQTQCQKLSELTKQLQCYRLGIAWALNKDPKQASLPPQLPTYTTTTKMERIKEARIDA